MSSDLKIKFGEPEHGWLPIVITTPDTSVTIEASEIPKDPVSEIISSLERSYLYGDKTEAWLDLEPHFYKLVFSPENNEIKLIISFVEIHDSITSPGNEEKRESVEMNYTCSRNKMLISFWRGLKEISSRVSRYNDAVARLELKVNEIKKS